MPGITREPGVLAPPIRPMSTNELRDALRQTRPRRTQKRSSALFQIAEDISPESAIDVESHKEPNIRGCISDVTKTRLTRRNLRPPVAPPATYDTAATVREQKRSSESMGMRREPRRRTIFIPDDATITTIHPGCLDNQTTDMSLYKKSIRPSLAKAPKRFPLREDQSVMQTPNLTIDRAGPLTGKENVPPGLQLVGKLDHDTRVSVKPQLSVKSEANTASLSASLPESERLKPDTSLRKTHPSESSTTCARKQGTKRKYPVIQEDIKQMRFYENDWVCDQEIVLTDILNRIFDHTSTRSEASSKAIRQKMLDLRCSIEHSKPMTRIKSSIEYGALSLPKSNNYTSKAARHINDVATRSQYVALWINNYDLKLLAVALEAVTGRQVPNDHADQRSVLHDFIETCLLLNEDLSIVTKRNVVDKDKVMWSHTMHRSLDIILLLDRVQQDGFITANLMQQSSKHKSSQAILEELMILLRGSSIDSVRILRSLGYTVSYYQELLSEYNYHVSNMATDFRDGIRLGRITELVMSKSDQGNPQTRSSRVKSSSLTSSLNLDLKYPATTRVHKIHNIRTILKVLNETTGISHISSTIDAADIVDGHRESTVALLWTIVSHIGVGMLLDSDDLKGEIFRLQKELENDSTNAILESEDDVLSNTSAHQAALKQWLKLLGLKHGIPVTNFSTAFSITPSPFSAIIKEYLPYMCVSPKTQPIAIASTLEGQLKQIGCGSTFSKLFSKSKIFDSNFILNTLAFLASRVLSGSKETRRKRAVLKELAKNCAVVVQARDQIETAASVIQRVWRRYRLMKNVKAIGEKAEIEAAHDYWLL